MKILLTILTLSIGWISQAQTTNCSYSGTPITVGTSCSFTPFNSTNSSDYWNWASGCNADDLDDAWWYFTATGTSTTITYNPDSRDAILHLFTGSCSSSMVWLACADDFGNGGAETISAYPTVIGVQYAIRIQRYNSNNNMFGEISVYLSADTLNNSSSATETACDSYTAPDGAVYTSTGNYTAVITNAAGCDSTITIDLTVNNSTSGSVSITACDSYTWMDGVTYTQNNNTATYILTTAAGCDSTITLDLTINQSTTATDVQTACGSYTWMDGVTYTQNNNTATYILTTAAGCDSTVTLDLTINQSTTATDVQTACGNYTWVDGVTYTQSNNTATYVMINAVGCDSTVMLDLTIEQPPIEVIACESYTWSENNQTYTNSGVYAAVNNGPGSCDSIYLDLTINPSTTGTDVQTACDSYTWLDGVTYTQSNNTATYVLTNAIGCDSTVTLDLTIYQSTTGTDVQTVCESYTWMDGVTYTQNNNTATYVLTNAIGCDSIVTLDLTINQSTTATDVQTACDSYTWMDGVTYTQSNNTATYVLTNAVGCDSTVTLSLTMNYFQILNEDTTACNAYTWLANGQIYNTSGFHSTQLTDQYGCDSIINLDLTIYYDSDTTINSTAVDAYTLNSQVYTASGVYTQTLQNMYGCDSTITLNLIILYTGLTEPNLDYVTLYPNPTYDRIYFSGLEGFEKASVLIEDQIGRVVDVYQDVSHSNIKEGISIRDLSTGQYFVHLSFLEYNKTFRVIKF